MDTALSSTVSPQRGKRLLESVPTGLLIDGTWRPASDGGTCRRRPHPRPVRTRLRLWTRQPQQDFALLMTLDMGKPLAEARGEVSYGAGAGRFRPSPLRPFPPPAGSTGFTRA